MSRGGGAAGNGDEVGQLLAGERLAAPLLPLVVQHRLQPADQEALARVVDRADPDVQRAGHLDVAPAVRQFHQDARPGLNAGGRMAAVHPQ
jgi:hypothetical protein